MVKSTLPLVITKLDNIKLPVSKLETLFSKYLSKVLLDNKCESDDDGITNEIFIFIYYLTFF